MNAPTCPVCGTAGAVCGGPSLAVPVDQTIDERSKPAMPREMVLIEVKPGDVRKVSAEDRERFLAAHEGAAVVGEAPQREAAATPGLDDLRVSSTVPDTGVPGQEPVSQRKARRPVEDKAVSGPARSEGGQPLTEGSEPATELSSDTQRETGSEDE